MQLGVAILAAGASSRMGQPKLLLPWGATTVLGHLLAQWQQVGAAQVTAVVAAGDAGMNGELDRLGFPRAHRVTNPDPARGMFSSIQCSARWSGWEPVLTHFAITLGDQPHLQVETLRAVAGFSSQHPGCICQPSFNGRPRHPVILPRTFLQELGEASCATFKEFLARKENCRRFIELPDPGLDVDLDSPADYEAALRRFT